MKVLPAYLKKYLHFPVFTRTLSMCHYYLSFQNWTRIIPNNKETSLPQSPAEKTIKGKLACNLSTRRGFPGDQRKLHQKHFQFMINMKFYFHNQQLAHERTSPCSNCQNKYFFEVSKKCHPKYLNQLLQ